MLSRPRESHQLLPPNNAKDGSQFHTSESAIGSEPASQQLLRTYGKPANKPLFNTFDLISLCLSIACLGLAIAAVSPSLQYAAQLQFTKQIIVVGFLLGVMAQCQQRVVPHLFHLLEVRFGRSTLQNYDGILRFAPLADHLSLLWRLLLIVSLFLPLGLGIAYKRLTGGIGLLHLPISGAYYAPTAPAGLENIGALGVMANATIPFMASSNEYAAPPDLSDDPQAFGFNLLMLSNVSAAALDGPVPNHVTKLQRQLEPGSAYYLSANVRGTITHYLLDVEAHRNDKAFWDPYYVYADVRPDALWNGYFFGFLNIETAVNNDPVAWDPSWCFLGNFPTLANMSDTESVRQAFQQTALGFITKRYPCQGTWKITYSSIQLISGTCESEPLDAEYQYLENSQLGLTQTYLAILSQYLGPFATTRNQSHWQLPTFTVVTASMYGSRIASAQAVVPVQPGGPIYVEDNINNDPDWQYNETYFVDNNRLRLEVPTLQAGGVLYLILAIQPVLTFAAFIATIMLYETPISAEFGLVSILAGVDRDSTALLAGASFSGKLAKPVGLGINVKPQISESHEHIARVEYVVGQTKCNGLVKLKNKYY